MEHIITVGEFFGGGGGFAKGFSDAHVNGYRYKHKFVVERNYYAANTYEINIDVDEVIREDIRKIDIAQLPKVNVFVFGFPCNDFSLAGNRKGLDGEYGPLYTYGVRYLNEHEPEFFVGENVQGLETANDGLAFQQIKQDLANAGKHGYTLIPHLYKFEHYGVPQTRHRIIIVGIRRDLGLWFEVPAPTTPVPIAVSIALEGVENVPFNQEVKNHNASVRRLLSNIPPGGSNKNAPWQVQIKSTRHDCYRKLHPDKPSPTITARGGGGTEGFHWEKLRALTNRERARIQTFPDDFRFIGSVEEVRSQIGMAVPPGGARIIAEALLKTMAGVQYPSVEAKYLQTE